jgi:hypothetical protein
MKNHLEVVKYMMQVGANKDRQNKVSVVLTFAQAIPNTMFSVRQHGQTALDWAMSEDIKRLLRQPPPLCKI